jgi:hypothetical protein
MVSERQMGVYNLSGPAALLMNPFSTVRAILFVMKCSYDFGKLGLVLRNTSYFDAWKDGHLIGEFDPSIVQSMLYS